MKSSSKKRVLMALSGGIDSAVSLHLLLKAGYEVEAAFMKNWSDTAGLKLAECPWLDDRRSALRVAAFFGVKLHTLDFEKEYQNTVMNYFFKEYKAGRTPNPDVMCNKEIKFKLLYAWAIKNGFEYMATGHYAIIVESRKSKVESRPKKGSRLTTVDYRLERSVDEFKDQTYFTYNIKTEQLPHVLFPVGGMEKTRVKALAKKLKLPNAERKESMGLCFVGKIRLKEFLEQKLKPKKGPIIDQSGKTIGEHAGLYYYTIGQRQGINVGPGGPYYVVKKDLAKNSLYVTNNPNDKSLLTKEIGLHSINWINKPLVFPSKLTGRFRHQGELAELTIEPILQGPTLLNTRSDLVRGKLLYKVKFSKQQKAIASGQSLVLYNNTECVGGGVIV